MTKIEWTERTWNPVTGCTKCSPGCLNCYAETMTRRLQAMGQPKYAAGFDRVVCHEGLVHWPLNNLQNARKSKMVFVNSMSDTFHKDVPFAFIDKMFGNMMLLPMHNFQVLTKRPDRMVEFAEHHWQAYRNKWPSNVWAGATVCTPGELWKLDYMLEVPAAVRFVSLEPLLADLGDISAHLKWLDWVIVGGESGPGARPMYPGWVRSIRYQCMEAGTPFFFKQWGAWAGRDCDEATHWITSGGDVGEWDRSEPSESVAACISKVGKKAAGRLLDGRTWDQYPEGIK